MKTRIKLLIVSVLTIGLSVPAFAQGWPKPGKSTSSARKFHFMYKNRDLVGPKGETSLYKRQWDAFKKEALESGDPKEFFDEHFEEYNEAAKKHLKKRGIEIKFADNVNAYDKALVNMRLVEKHRRSIKMGDKKVTYFIGKARMKELESELGKEIVDKLKLGDAKLPYPVLKKVAGRVVVGAKDYTKKDGTVVKNALTIDFDDDKGQRRRSTYIDGTIYKGIVNQGKFVDGPVGPSYIQEVRVVLQRPVKSMDEKTRVVRPGMVLERKVTNHGGFQMIQERWVPAGNHIFTDQIDGIENMVKPSKAKKGKEHSMLDKAKGMFDLLDSTRVGHTCSPA